MTLKEKLDQLKFYNTGDVKSDANLVKYYRQDILKLVEALELAMSQRDFFIRCSRDRDVDREKDMNNNNELILKKIV